MPSPYIVSGIIGGLAILGFAVWTLFTQNQQYEQRYSEGTNNTNFKPGPGYDRPRNNFEEGDWGESPSGRRRRNRNRKTDKCPICQEPLKSEEFLRSLPCCRNRFHDACITEWFQVKRTCPICRKNQ